MVEQEKVNPDQLKPIGRAICNLGKVLFGNDPTVNSIKMDIGEYSTFMIERSPNSTIFREAELVTIVSRPYGSDGILKDVHAFYNDGSIFRRVQAVDKVTGSADVAQPEQLEVNKDDLFHILNKMIIVNLNRE